MTKDSEFKTKIFNQRLTIRKCESKVEQVKEELKEAKAKLAIEEGRLKKILDGDDELPLFDKPKRPRKQRKPASGKKAATESTKSNNDKSQAEPEDKWGLDFGSKALRICETLDKSKAGMTVAALAKKTKLADKTIKKECLALGDKGIVLAVGQRFQLNADFQLEGSEDQPAAADGESPKGKTKLSEFLTANPIKGFGPAKSKKLCDAYATVEEFVAAIKVAKRDEIDPASIVPKGITKADTEKLLTLLAGQLVETTAEKVKRILNQLTSESKGPSWMDAPADHEKLPIYEAGRKAFTKGEAIDGQDFTNCGDDFIAWFVRGWKFEESLKSENQPTVDEI